MDFSEKLIKSEHKYSGIIVDVRVDTVSLPNGNTAKREIVTHPGGVTVLPVDDNGDVYLVRQYRYAYGRHLLEAPAGKLESGENPLECAVRELSEETGASAKELIFLGDIYPSPGFCDESLYIYLATGLTFALAHPDEDEFLSVVKIPLAELYKKIASLEIHDAKTIVAALRAKQFFEVGGENL